MSLNIYRIMGIEFMATESEFYTLLVIIGLMFYLLYICIKSLY